MADRNYIKGSIWGLIVGDALGVPVEFLSRKQLRENPVTDMREYGSHYQPKGTWSDDSSMMLCTLDSLSKGKIDYDDIMAKFASWFFDGEYSPYGTAFDFGGVTRDAINRYRNGVAPLECGGRSDWDNGNGSLMRILPAVLFQVEKSNHFSFSYRPGVFEPVCKVSALTHAHPISLLGCGLYAQLIGTIINYKFRDEHVSSEDNSKLKLVYCAMRDNLVSNTGWNYNFVDLVNLQEYDRLKDVYTFSALPEEEIKSGGYVVDTLEAAVWCFLNTDSYADCVLKAVNLGRDTDTTAAVAGSIAGAYYGMEGIPAEWLECLARKDWIAELIEKFEVATADLNVN